MCWVVNENVFLYFGCFGLVYELVECVVGVFVVEWFDLFEVVVVVV